MSLPYGPYLEQALQGRVLVIGDSNAVLPAGQLVAAGSGFSLGTPMPALTFDFACAVPGVGLRDLEEILARLDDLHGDFAAGIYAAVLINLGANDLLLQDANWPTWFAGPLSYPQRVEILLGALPDVPIFWVGVPTGLPAWCHPWERAAVNLTLFAAENPSAVAALGLPHLLPPSGQADPRLLYLEPDVLLGSVTPRFLPDGVHYTPAAASVLYVGVCAALRAELA